MAKKITSQEKNVSSKKEDRFEWLARVMKESFEDTNQRMADMESRFNKKLEESVEESEGRLRTEIRNSEENLQYRIATVAGDGYRRLDLVEPKIADHERRIRRLEHREPVQV